MEALLAYASDSDSDGTDFVRNASPPADQSLVQAPALVLPPPPDDLLTIAGNNLGAEVGGRVRSFPHVKGNYALHVYIPVNLSAGVRKKLEPFLKKAAVILPGLRSGEDDGSGASSATGGGALSFEKEYHISLSRTVPIRVHQIDSVVQMLRHKLSSQKSYWTEYGVWEAFSNDDQTRSFLALEIVSAGLTEITKQVRLVDAVYQLHNLPTFYKNPRPHISLAWICGKEVAQVQEVSKALNNLPEKNTGNNLWASPATRIECKIGQKVYPVWTSNTPPLAAPGAPFY